MSWDAYLECQCCGDAGSREWNYTHNTSRMIYAVLYELPGRERPTDDQGRPVAWYRELDGLTGAESLDLLVELANGLADPALDALNPENGWGSRSGLLGVVREMRDAAQDSPKMVWAASG